MYSREDRIKAVELWLKYDKSETAVIHELGYPSHKMLPKWHREMQIEQETGIIRDNSDRCSMYTREQKQAAVDHYLEHGRCLARTVRALGYPSKQALSGWCEELVPKQRKRSGNGVQFTHEQKKDAVIALCSRRGSAKQVAEAHGTNRESLYSWKRELLGKERAMAKTTGQADDLPDDRKLSR